MPTLAPSDSNAPDRFCRHVNWDLVSAKQATCTEEGVIVRAEVNGVVLLLAEEFFAARLEGDPFVAQGELIHHIVLKGLHELAADDTFPCGGF